MGGGAERGGAGPGGARAPAGAELGDELGAGAALDGGGLVSEAREATVAHGGGELVEGAVEAGLRPEAALLAVDSCTPARQLQVLSSLNSIGQASLGRIRHISRSCMATALD